MSDNDSTTRTCKLCQIEKPLTEFYGRGKYHFHQCKECMKAQANQRPYVDRKVSRVPTEDDVIHELQSMGIPALPGKALSHYYADVIAWGCVLMEVKCAKWDGHAFNFPFSSQHVNGRIRGQLVVLVCCYDDHQTYHIFNADNPVFYNNGTVKAAVHYIPKRKSTRGYNSLNAMTLDMMAEAQNRWYMVERWRLDLSDQLRNGLVLPIAA